jgi:hypothetical protein
LARNDGTEEHNIEQNSQAQKAKYHLFYLFAESELKMMMMIYYHK